MKRLRFAVPVLAALILALVCASGANAADGTSTFGISGVTPSMDTANGDLNDSQTAGLTLDASDSCPTNIECSPETNPLTKSSTYPNGTNPLLPGPFSGENKANTPHSGEDLGVWNPDATAPSDGQVLQIQVTGCARNDPNADPEDQESQGIPVNTVLFQTLTASGSNWNVGNTAGSADANGTYPFQIPFCKNATDGSTATANTVTTFAPLHLCINAGDVVAFHDLGGYVSSGSEYPQGIPMEVLAPTSSSSTDSFIGVNANPIGPGIYGPGDDTNTSGYATEADQEVTMQVTEGTGNDAYGLCNGGFGDEPANSNAIDCDFTTSASNGAANPTKYPDHPFCANAGQPIPGSNLPGYVAPGSGSSGTSTPSSGGSGSTTPVAPPVITNLKSNPPLFVAKKGAVFTYVDSHPGLTTLRFYLIEGKKLVLYKTIKHQDKEKVGFLISGWKPGSYEVKASSVYKGVVGKTVTANFQVILTRTKPPVITNLKSNPPLFVAKKGAVFTYVDSHPGLTTLRFYLIEGKKLVLYKTIKHQDKAKVGFLITGWKAGSYEVKATSVYQGLTSATVVAKFKVVLKR